MKTKLMMALLSMSMAFTATTRANSAESGAGFWLGESRKELCESSFPSAAIRLDPSGKMRSKAPTEPAGKRTEADFWNGLALDLIVKYQRNPLRAARVLALLNTGMQDALSCLGAKESTPQARVAAMGSVAAETLEYLFPQEPDGRFQAQALARLLPQAQDSKMQARRGWAYGKSVALAVIKRAATDGADRVWDVSTRPANRPGLWRASPPVYSTTPVEAMAGTWRTWVLKDGGELQPPPPTEYGSEAYWREVEEVRTVGAKLTDEQKRIADAWHLGNGTVTPVGVWAREGLRLMNQARMPDQAAARLMATLSVAMMDASITCWRVKFTYWTERPVTIIREKFDADFMPYLVTPSFPSYLSGHATISGAAATVLSGFFPGKAKAIQGMAEEAAISRLYGGIHFASDNNEGLKLGRRIGERVMSAQNRVERKKRT